jgi:hypothetical protein
VSAEDYKLMESMPGVGKAGDSATFPQYITGVYSFAMAFAAISALLMVTIGGFYYIVSAGNQAQAGTAKTIIKDALLGLVVVFVTWLILNQINPDLIKATPDLSTIQSAAKSTTKPAGNIQQSTTVVGSNGKPYNSEADCKSAGNTSCKPAQLAYDDAAQYQKQTDGTYKKVTDPLECGGGAHTCLSGAQLKASNYGNVKTATEIENNIKEKSGATVSKDVDPKTISAPLEDKIIKDVKTGDPDKTKGAEVVETSGQYADSAKIQATAGETASEDNQMTREIADKVIEKNGAQKQGTKEKTLEGGFTETTTTYIVPEGMSNAGSKYDVIVVKDGFSTVNVKLETYATKVTPPKAKTPLIEVDPDMPVI